MQAMRRLKWVIPSLSALNAQDEAEFNEHLVQRSRTALAVAAICFAVFMLVFCLLDIYLGDTILSLSNIARFCAAASIMVFLLLSAYLPPAMVKQGWLGISALCLLLLAVTFYNNGHYYGELREGGPLIVTFAIATIPVFHLLQKALLWALLLSLILFLKVCLGINTGWTLFYLSFAVVMCAVFQRQIDILLRTQFKAMRLERQKAETDQLTGVLNRRSFDKRLQEKLQQLQAGQQLSLGLLDIDYFKRYNDTYGHLDGDMVLVRVAKQLSANPDLLVVRFGGEEFILLEQHQAGTEPAMLKIPQQFIQLAITHKASPFGVVTASLGIITLPPAASTFSYSQLMQQADALLYQAKNNGRNQAVHSFHS